MKSVVICGSASFAKEMRAFAKKLKELGIDVYEPHLYQESGGKWDEIKDYDKEFVALGLTHDHFYKMRMADVVYIFNKDGYSGNSTSMEIGYAAALNKPIYAHSGKDDDLCRHVLFRKIVSNPEELVGLLK